MFRVRNLNPERAIYGNVDISLLRHLPHYVTRILQITMSNKAKKTAKEVVRPKGKTGSKKSWRRLMWDAVSIYDVEAVSFCIELHGLRD